MKTLFLLRHAKSVPASDRVRDFDRSLNDQGRRQAEWVGKYLQQQKILFDLVLSSTALRARETTELVLATAECVVEARYNQTIYEASRQQLEEEIAEIGEDKSSVLLVGHNPGLEQLLYHLTDHSWPMKTATLAKIDLATSEWNKTSGAKGHLDWRITPN